MRRDKSLRNIAYTSDDGAFISGEGSPLSTNSHLLNKGMGGNWAKIRRDRHDFPTHHVTIHGRCSAPPLLQACVPLTKRHLRGLRMVSPFISFPCSAWERNRACYLAPMLRVGGLVQLQKKRNIPRVNAHTTIMDGGPSFCARRRRASARGKLCSPVLALRMYGQ